MNRTVNLDGVSSDIQMNDGRVVLGKDQRELFEASASETVLADVNLCEPFVVLQDSCDHR